MTREEAIKIIETEYKCVNRDCDIERSCGKCDLMMPTKEPILEAYKMAIEALKQESILDKIRTEIEQYNRKPSHYPINMISIETVLQIIDKYRGE